MVQAPAGEGGGREIDTPSPRTHTPPHKKKGSFSSTVCVGVGGKYVSPSRSTTVALQKSWLDTHRIPEFLRSFQSITRIRDAQLLHEHITEPAASSAGMNPYNLTY
jgi:hypothetical protein